MRTGVSGRWVIIEVTDNGMGVPPDKRKVIFERFTRVEGRRGKAGGHGLGLAFVAETAEAHRGLVECLQERTVAHASVSNFLGGKEWKTMPES